jgi:hypothetical protein
MWMLCSFRSELWIGCSTLLIIDDLNKEAIKLKQIGICYLTIKQGIIPLPMEDGGVSFFLMLGPLLFGIREYGEELFRFWWRWWNCVSSASLLPKLWITIPQSWRSSEACLFPRSRTLNAWRFYLQDLSQIHRCGPRCWQGDWICYQLDSDLLGPIPTFSSIDSDFGFEGIEMIWSRQSKSYFLL